MERDNLEPDPKRRKTRKGTRSCWECKRRKVRCIFESPEDATCIGCSRRCLACVSQEYPEGQSTPSARTRLVGDRIVRVEAMVKKLVQQAQTGPQPAEGPSASLSHLDTSPKLASAPESVGVPTPASHGTPNNNNLSICPILEQIEEEQALSNRHSPASLHPESRAVATAALAGTLSEYERVSAALLAVYPSEKDVDILVNSVGDLSFYMYQLMLNSHEALESNALDAHNFLRRRYTHKTHPILIMRQMFMLAILFQFATPEVYPEHKRLSPESKDVPKRLAEAATSKMSKNDDFMGTAEGLECMILEHMYHSNNGNLRRGWLALRNAISVAQLMGINRPHRPPLRYLEANPFLDPQFLWFRLMISDRFHCIMLGLSPASSDDSMVSETAMKNKSPTGRFERRLCVIANEILERNERDPSEDDFARTKDIDKELQQTATMVPTRWWQIPNITTANNHKEMFGELVKLIDQMLYYHLLNQLHLPYMLRSTSGSDGQRYDYSRLICVSASKDLLVRYVHFRTYNHVAFCCRMFEFVALMASLTLLLAHLHGRRAGSQSENVLIHQRLSDRAMMEQVVENMERVSVLSEDVLSGKSAEFVRQLLRIEEVANGSADGESDNGNTDGLDPARIYVPYFGLITITRDGLIHKEQCTEHEPGYLVIPGADGNCQSVPSARDSQTPYGFQVLTPAATDRSSEAEPLTSQQLLSERADGGPQDDSRERTAAAIAAAAQQGIPNIPVSTARQTDPQWLYPAPTAGYDKWTFQGVDMAFFESLMREANMLPGSGEGSNWWQFSNSTGNQ